MKRLAFVAVIVLALSGCLNRSPEDRILAAFGEAPGDWISFGEAQPQFLQYADEASARIFGSLTRNGKFRIAPKGQPLLCPSVAEPGNHGYALSVRVNSAARDSAIATVSGMCKAFIEKCPAGVSCGFMGNTMDYQTHYLLRRTSDGWKVEKPLSGSVIIPM